MPASTSLRPRFLRLNLSARYCHLQRRTQSSQTASHSSATPLPTPTRNSFLRRNRVPIVFSTLGLLLGLTAGSLIAHTVAPPALPAPGTSGDSVLLADLSQQIDAEFKVKVLRGKCLGVAKALKGEEGSGWVEIVPNPAPSSTGAAEDERKVEENGLLSLMRGAGSLGVERVFYSRAEQKLVAIVWFGGALSGWPGVTHGGCLATVLSEKLALAASLADGKLVRQGLAAAATPQRLPGIGSHAKMLAPTEKAPEPAHLSLTYVKPTYANKFYVVRVAPVLGLEQDGLTKDTPIEPVSGTKYEAVIETMDGKTLVKAQAQFASSRSTFVEHVEDGVVSAAKANYEEFKAWMWPSRQKSSSTNASPTLTT